MPAPTTTAQPAHFDVASLHLVKPEIDLSLSQVESVLSVFVDDDQNTAGLMDAAESMSQIHGILRLLNLFGASELSGAMATLLKEIADKPAQTKEDRLAAIGEGLMVLHRYLEFVLLRETLLPHLLLPITNTLNQLAGLPLLREGHFLTPHLNPQDLQNDGTTAAALTDPNNAALIRFLHRMYRHGLNHILMGNASADDYQLLQRAGYEMSRLAQGGASALYWQAAHSALTQLEACRPLTASRQRVLGLIERHFAQPQTQPQLADLTDVLALGACRDHAAADTLREQLQLQRQIATDQTSSDLARFLFGPNGEVIHTVNALVHGEINQIKLQIDSLIRGEPLEEGISGISERMVNLAYTLDMLNLGEAADQVRQQVEQEHVWSKADDQTSLNQLMDALMVAENAMTVLDKSYTSGTVMLPLNNMLISLHQLDEARATLVSESRGTVGMAMRSLMSYIESDHDMLHLDNVPVMLQTVSGAMTFLEAPRGSQILQRTAQFIARRFTPDQPPATPDELDRLADALVCIDYYLESIEVKKPAGEHPFTVGENSLTLLSQAA
ncbi:MAG: hypothetical protein VXW65_01910 [Pseudomonadota bacterium]|nr:hypothetical protein [Pseudomonadota bacterium]